MHDSLEAASVMVVEDEEELREQIIVPGLREEGFHVEGVGSAMALYRALSLRPYDAFVVDVGLPDENGFQVAQHLRKLGQVGIVMLTARAAVEDQVRGLDGGADAYLSKPVRTEVLAATLRSVLRRVCPDTRLPAAPEPTVSGWRLEMQGWQVVAPNGTQVALSQGERLFLMALGEAKGAVVAREAIVQHLSGNDYDFDPHRMEMLVHRLRRKVHASTGLELPLSTVRGIGYLLLL